MSRSDAVRVLGSLLAPGAEPGRSDPECGWPVLLDVAAEHRLLPALWPGWQAAADVATGADRAPFAILEDAYRTNARRVADLAAQGRDVLDAFAAAGIDAIPIKGWHGLLVGRWPDPARRSMVDLDVLVPEAAVDRGVVVLAELGYEDLGVIDPDGLAGHEVPARGRAGRAGSVEIHRAVLVPRRARILPAAQVGERAETVVLPDRVVRVPRPTDAMTILVAHAQLQDDGARLLRVPVRALVEAAVMLAGPEGPRVDWDEVTERFRRVRSSVPLAGFAVALDDLFGVAVPVSRRGGTQWWAAARALLDHPRTARGWRDVASLPRALSSDRMARRYGARTWAARQRARTRHSVHGMTRRLRRA